jgi:phosphohistidine phosphatase
MLVILNRHANAGARDSAQWPDDRDRPLTDKGRKVERDVGRALRKLDLLPTLVLTSPWVRAAQTAAALIEAAGLQLAPVPCDALAEDPDLIRLTDYVGDQPEGAIVAMVGHSPWIEELAALLLSGSSSTLRIDFPKSGLMGIELEKLAPGAGELRFFLRPKMV